MCFELVGYLLEELRDTSNFETFKRDLEDANVFIGSLIFIEELAEKVRGWMWVGWGGVAGLLVECGLVAVVMGLVGGCSSDAVVAQQHRRKQVVQQLCTRTLA